MRLIDADKLKEALFNDALFISKTNNNALGDYLSIINSVCKTIDEQPTQNTEDLIAKLHNVDENVQKEVIQQIIDYYNQIAFAEFVEYSSKDNNVGDS